MTSLARVDISEAAAPLGWRLVLDSLISHVAVRSLAEAAQVAGVVTAAADDTGPVALSLDLRADGVTLSLAQPASARPTPAVLSQAALITDALRAAELHLDPLADCPGGRSVQVVELAIDALDIPAVRPFWRAVLAYEDDTVPDDPGAALVDPRHQGPPLWFQQMDTPRPQRNRVHFDISVPREEAANRIEAALAAGGVLVGQHAPAFWVLADPEGNEACVCTWQGRDSWDAAPDAEL